jgi:hypothetical protein
MTVKEFYDLVVSVRNAQKTYYGIPRENVFAKRDALEKSLALEKELDKAIKSIAAGWHSDRRKRAILSCLVLKIR